MGTQGVRPVASGGEHGRLQAFLEGKTVLITGGAGAIGSNLARALATLNARTVIVFDDLSAAYEWNIPSLPNVLFVKGSVTDEAALKRVFAGRPDVVFHLAAFFANQNSVDYPQRDLKTNGLGTLLVLQYARCAGQAGWCTLRQGARSTARRRRCP